MRDKQLPISDFWGLLDIKDYLALIFILISLIFLGYISTIMPAIEQTFIVFLILSLALVYLLIDYKLSRAPIIYLKKFARDWKMEAKKGTLSYFHLDKKISEIFPDIAKATILFFAHKKIKNTQVELYLSQYHLPVKEIFIGRHIHHYKRLLFLEIENPNFNFSDNLIISKKLNYGLGLEKSNIKSEHAHLNLKFDHIKNPHNLSDLISKININAVTSIDLPIGLITEEKKIIIFTAEEYVSYDGLKKLWQILDWAGGY